MLLGDLLLDVLPPLLAADLAESELFALGLPVVLTLAVLAVGVLKVRILADLGVGLRVHLLETIGYIAPLAGYRERSGEGNNTFDTVIQILLELRFIPLLVIVRQSLHVLRHMPTKDILPQCVRLQLLRLDVKAREPAL